MSERRPTPVNVVLGEEHEANLHGLAERTHVNPGTLARSMQATALDQADPDPAAITALLDAIPGALDRAQQGLADARAGRVVALDDL